MLRRLRPLSSCRYFSYWSSMYLMMLRKLKHVTARWFFTHAYMQLMYMYMYMYMYILLVVTAEVHEYISNTRVHDSFNITYGVTS